MKKNYAIRSGLLASEFEFQCRCWWWFVASIARLCITALNIMKIKLFHKPLSSNTINVQQTMVLPGGGVQWNCWFTNKENGK